MSACADCIQSAQADFAQGGSEFIRPSKITRLKLWHKHAQGIWNDLDVQRGVACRVAVYLNGQGGIGSDADGFHAQVMHTRRALEAITEQGYSVPQNAPGQQAAPQAHVHVEQAVIQARGGAKPESAAVLPAIGNEDKVRVERLRRVVVTNDFNLAAGIAQGQLKRRQHVRQFSDPPLQFYIHSPRRRAIEAYARHKRKPARSRLPDIYPARIPRAQNAGGIFRVVERQAENTRQHVRRSHRDQAQRGRRIPICSFSAAFFSTRSCCSDRLHSLQDIVDRAVSPHSDNDFTAGLNGGSGQFRPLPRPT